MKSRFIVFETKTPEWLKVARDEYVYKLKPYLKLDLELIKSPAVERDQAEMKIEKEADLLLKRLDRDEALVLFDVAGKMCKDSRDFSVQVQRLMNLGKSKVSFVIGGAYGFAHRIQGKADQRWSLSPLTMNHWVAQLLALEQLYRAFAIQRGMPYHNE